MCDATTAAKAIQDAAAPGFITENIGVVLARLNEAITHLEDIRAWHSGDASELGGRTVRTAVAALACLRNEDA